MSKHFMNCRPVPRNAFDRYSGEGDPCLRDTEHRICAWRAGYSDEDWEALKRNNPNWHESVGYYDVVEGGIR